jgi:TolA-binding protein
MLMMNQQWVEKSAKLQSRIKELEDERVDLIETFKTKITSVDEEILKTKEHAVAVVKEHERVVAEFESKIEDLEGTINDLNLELSVSRKKMKELQEAAENPFNKEEAEEGPNKNDKDLSQEYAIMDITGKGDDIVAKIINTDGKVFIVHKGSMLKNGEVVTAITDHYISFENKGVKSYLYTGNTIVEYEPEASFGGTNEILSSALPEENKEAVQEIVEDAVAAKIAEKNAKAKDKEKQTAPKKGKKAPRTNDRGGSSTPSSPHVSAPSFGRGMFGR